MMNFGMPGIIINGLFVHLFGKIILLTILLSILLSVSFQAKSMNFNLEDGHISKIDTSCVSYTIEDSLIFSTIMDSLKKIGMKDSPINEIIIRTGKLFLGRVYSSCTLESNVENKLRVNLRQLDCVTFVESVLSISRIYKMGKYEFSDFVQELENIRYRNGKLNEFPSRLHYFTDWIYDKGQMGIITDLTTSFDSVPRTKTINYMTTHRDSYPRMDVDSFFVEMQRIEQEISDRTYYYLPKEKIAALEKNIINGDIIVFVTNIDGLDVVHVGFAIWNEGKKCLLHASSQFDHVIISDKSISQYISGKKVQTGIIIVRAVDINN